jgi:hypothetical protein
VKSFIFGILAIFALVPDVFGQAGWTQKLDGWIDGAYQPYLFLGGNYYTKVSFTDIDGDGDYDMFYAGGNTGSFRLFENIGTRFSPNFKLKDITHPGLIVAAPLTLDADFADLDDDGDLDAVIMLGNSWGPSRRYVNTGNAQQPRWIEPPYGQQIIIGGDGPPAIHDYDNDGDYDLINGMYRDSIYLFQNTNDPIPLYFHMVTNRLGNIFIGSTFNMDVEDMDADGDYDIIACVTGGVNKRYENIGGSGNFQFVLVDSNFLGGQYMPDWLECPELVDIDGDGDLDLFLAGAFAHLNYFENIGTPQIPQFTHRYDTAYFYNFVGNVNRAKFVDIDGDNDLDIAAGTTILRNLGPVNDPNWQTELDYFPHSYANTFCDIDGDGDYDMLAPWQFGVILFRNTGSPQEPSWDEGHYVIMDSTSGGVYSLTAADMDADGDYDIALCGDDNMDLIYYENAGDAYNPQFRYSTGQYTGFRRLEGDAPFDPVFGDIDNDGDIDLLIAHPWSSELRPKLWFYKNIGTRQQAIWDSVTDDYMGWFSSGLLYYSYVNFGDYDADGDADILMSFSQGMRLMINQTISNIENDNLGETDNHFSVRTYPNPFNRNVTFAINSQITGQVVLEIFNILGQQIDSISEPYIFSNQMNITWDSKNNSSGIYFYKIAVGKYHSKGRFIVLK